MQGAKTFKIITRSKPVAFNLGAMLFGSFGAGVAYLCFKNDQTHYDAQKV